MLSHTFLYYYIITVNNSGILSRTLVNACSGVKPTHSQYKYSTATVTVIMYVERS